MFRRLLIIEKNDNKWESTGGYMQCDGFVKYFVEECINYKNCITKLEIFKENIEIIFVKR